MNENKELIQTGLKIDPETGYRYIIRHSHPNKYDHAPKGTLCLVQDGSTGSTYRQMSDDEENPVWIEM